MKACLAVVENTARCHWSAAPAAIALGALVWFAWHPVSFWAPTIRAEAAVLSVHPSWSPPAVPATVSLPQPVAVAPLAPVRKPVRAITKPRRAIKLADIPKPAGIILPFGLRW